MKVLKITVVDEEVHVDGIGQNLYIGPKHLGLDDYRGYRGIDIECEQVALAAKGIMKNFNLPETAYKPLRFRLAIALGKRSRG